MVFSRKKIEITGAKTLSPGFINQTPVKIPNDKEKNNILKKVLEKILKKENEISKDTKKYANQINVI